MPESWINALFPSKPRWFTGERWVNIGLRSLHLVGITGMAGGFLFDLPDHVWALYWHIGMASGVALALLYVWATAVWLFELKGLAILVKLALLGLALVQPALRGEVFIAVLLLSGVVAHAPAKVRGWRWIKLPASVELRHS